jgi:putative salt-induced outer membrane protein YdiY
MHAHAYRFVCRSVMLALAVLLLTAASAFADVVQLMNGDRITGRVVSLAGGTLVFKTSGGDINIPWNQITSIQSTETLRVSIAGRPGKQTITGMAMGTPGQLVLTPGGPVALADVTDLGPVEKPLTITGGASAGFLNSGGNTDSFSLRLDADATIRQNLNRYTATAALNRAKDRLIDVDTAKNWNTAFNYDRFLNKRLFLNANAIFTNDEFRDLDLRSAYGLGVGYQVFDTAKLKLTANAGLGWVNENFVLADDNDYTAARESAALDIFAIPHRVEFFHKHDGYFGLKGDDNLFIRTHNGVRLTVIKNFVTTVQWDVDYDASPSPGRKSTDRTFALTFGYRF